MVPYGMAYLLVSIMAYAILHVLLRIAQTTGRNIMATISINYLAAAFVSLIVTVFIGEMESSSFTVYFGVLMGFLFLAGFVIVTFSFNLRGVALTSAIVQLSVLIPTLLSILIWGDSSTLLQTVGIVLALMSLPLLSIKEVVNSIMDRKLIITTVASFVISGLCQSAGKILLEAGYSNQHTIFYFILYITAFVAAIPLAINKRIMPSIKDLTYGSIVGVLNAIGNLSLAAALLTISGSIAFPLWSSTGLMVTVLLSLVILKENMSRLNVVGIAIALAAVIFINLG